MATCAVHVVRSATCAVHVVHQASDGHVRCTRHTTTVVLTQLVHNVHVALVVVVVHCHLCFDLRGPGVGMGHCGEFIDPAVDAEEDDGLGTVPS